MTFQYSVFNLRGALVGTFPTLQGALDKAKQYGGYVQRRGVTIWRAKSKTEVRP